MHTLSRSDESQGDWVFRLVGCIVVREVDACARLFVLPHINTTMRDHVQDWVRHRLPYWKAYCALPDLRNTRLASIAYKTHFSLPAFPDTAMRHVVYHACMNDMMERAIVLEFPFSGWRDEDIVVLSFVLANKKLPHLTALDLQGNELTDEGVVALAVSIRLNGVRALRTLNVASNPFGNHGFVTLMSALSSCPNMVTLSSYGTDVDDRGVCRDECATVPSLPHLQDLFLMENVSTAFGSYVLRASSTLPPCCRLVRVAFRGIVVEPRPEICYRGRELSADDISVMAHVFARGREHYQPLLTHLDVSHNHVCNWGMRVLCDAMRTCVSCN